MILHGLIFGHEIIKEAIKFDSICSWFLCMVNFARVLSSTKMRSGTLIYVPGN
jgi:hypothetical protein